MTEEQELSALLGNAQEDKPGTRVSSPPSSSDKVTNISYDVWHPQANDKFYASSRTIERLPAGIYQVGHNYDKGYYLEKKKHTTDDIVELPDAVHQRVLRGIQKFWGSEAVYRKHGLLYKRGILLWGPPGSGKTVLVASLMYELVNKHDGIVLIATAPVYIQAILPQLRRIEPDRPLIVVWEDLDEIIHIYGEGTVLAILDGEDQINNVIHIATTNYPDRLGARIVNRPSRFDERMKLGMPSQAARLAYLSKVCAMADVPVQQWCDDTDGLSIAHLRELAAAVLCLGQDYQETLVRLRAMTVRPKGGEDGFRQGNVGLGK